MTHWGPDAMFTVAHGAVAYHSRDGVFEDELLLAVVFEQNGVLVERPYLPCQLDSAHEVDRNRRFILADRIEERVLNVLCRLVIHMPISPCR